MRLFIAVRPPAEACAHLAAALGTPADPRWHLTLAFLGEQPAAEAFDLSTPARHHAPFALALSGGNTLNQRAVATGVRGDVQALRHLATDVQKSCREAGAHLERRRFLPHLTVARGNADQLLPVLWDYEGPPWTVREVELVHSVIGRTATHTVLRRFPLAASSRP